MLTECASPDNSPNVHRITFVPDKAYFRQLQSSDRRGVLPNVMVSLLRNTSLPVHILPCSGMGYMKKIRYSYWYIILQNRDGNNSV